MTSSFISSLVFQIWEWVDPTNHVLGKRDYLCLNNLAVNKSLLYNFIKCSNKYLPCKFIYRHGENKIIIYSYKLDSSRATFPKNFLMALGCQIVADWCKQIKRKVNGQESFATVMGSDSTAICEHFAFVKDNPYWSFTLWGYLRDVWLHRSLKCDCLLNVKKKPKSLTKCY